jgi:hypothetical protein
VKKIVTFQTIIQFYSVYASPDRLCALVVRVPGCCPEVLISIPGGTRFSEWQWVWKGVHPALVRINEELLERKVAAPV